MCTKKISYRGQERGLLTCYPDATVGVAKELMEARGVKQLPVVKRGEVIHKGKRRKLLGLLHYDSIWSFLRLKKTSVFTRLKIEIDQKPKLIFFGLFFVT